MTAPWENLPCKPTLAAIMECPHGVVEVLVEYFPGNSGVGGGDPQEPATNLSFGRVWGLDCAALSDLNDAFDQIDDERLAGVPSGATVLFRVELDERPAIDVVAEQAAWHHLRANWGLCPDAAIAAAAAERASREPTDQDIEDWDDDDDLGGEG